jgi:hypothetical protein
MSVEEKMSSIFNSSDHLYVTCKFGVTILSCALTFLAMLCGILLEKCSLVIAL